MLTQSKIDATTEAAELAYTQSYYHTAFEVQRGLGVGWSMQTLNDDVLKKVLSRPWTTDGQTFTARCWTDHAKLVQSVNQELARMFATGASPDKAIAAIAKQFNTSKSNAGRVVMTESAFFSSAAQKDCFNELDVEQYRVVGTLDVSTCETCGSMDGTVFKMSEYVVGSTAPPFHPWCRCCTAPYFADMEGIGDRFARDAETGERYTLPKDITYNEWKEMQDATHGSGFVDKKRKLEYNISDDKAQYERYKNVLRELAPESFEDFQDVKYNNPAKWREIKHQYRIVNQYKVDAGSVTAKQIYDLDKKVYAEKRLNFASKFKKSGNIAGAYITGGSNSGGFYLAHSFMNDAQDLTKYRGGSTIVGLAPKRRFEYIDVKKADGSMRPDAYFDTEAKLFEYFDQMYDEQPFSEITMLSERGMCDSCKGVMRQFMDKHPDVKVNVVSNKKVEGNVWKYRR